MRAVKCVGENLRCKFSDSMTERLCLRHEDLDAGIFVRPSENKTVPIPVRALKRQLRSVVRFHSKHKGVFHKEVCEYASKKLREIKYWPDDFQCVIL